MELIDSAEPARPGEELDARRLLPFLQEAIPGLEGDLEVLQFPSGFSNLTYLVKGGDREIVIRRPPFGSKPKSGHDMKREFTILSALQDSFPYCPSPLVYSDDTSILGASLAYWIQADDPQELLAIRMMPTHLEGSPTRAEVVARYSERSGLDIGAFDFTTATDSSVLPPSANRSTTGFSTARPATRGLGSSATRPRSRAGRHRGHRELRSVTPVFQVDSEFPSTATGNPSARHARIPPRRP